MMCTVPTNPDRVRRRTICMTEWDVVNVSRAHAP